jgi:ATPase family associated with various cellular activities (AAA)
VVTDQHGRYAVMTQGPSPHEPRLQIEVAGLPVEEAQRLLAELDQLRAELNVYRGHLLDVSLDPMGNVHLSFADPPALTSDDVVLPTAVLARVERHALGVACHRARCWPSGSTSNAACCCTARPARQDAHPVLPDGPDDRLHPARAHRPPSGSRRSGKRPGPPLLPAVVVLEDVDLVTDERSLGPASSPVLFDLLDAMDGAASDADLLFLLTTNRADLLEPALAARPGRVDVAVEIALQTPLPGTPAEPVRPPRATLCHEAVYADPVGAVNAHEPDVAYVG